MAAKKNAVKAQSRRGGGSGVGLWLGLIIFIAAVIMIPAVALLLMVGLAPTIVSWLANQSPNRKPQLLTVLVFNLAGIMPYLKKVLHSQRGIDTVMEMFGNVFSWLVMYGAAASAMLVLLMMPQVAAIVLQIMAHERLKNIATVQARLVEEWGEAVAGDSD